MTKEERDNLREAAKRATPGPWEPIHKYEKNYDKKGAPIEWQGAEIHVPSLMISKLGTRFDGSTFVVKDKHYICDNYDYEEGGVCSSKEDSEYIAQANPKAILNLLDALDHMEKREEILKDLVEWIYNGISHFCHEEDQEQVVHLLKAIDTNLKRCAEIKK